MLVFTFAINYQGKLLTIENRMMRAQLLRYSLGDEGKELLTQEMNIRLVQEFNLTPKEITVLKLLAYGKINKEIGNEINISIKMVKFHIKKIYQKLEASSRQEARQKYFSVTQF